MRRWKFTWLIGLFLLVPRTGWSALKNQNPVVVELFDSQGCSSCPPSEKVMKDLRKQFGSSVILLTFHVHYWDNLGWKDPYSDPLYTNRQKMYGDVFRQNTIYTPEMVIQGDTGFVGSEGDRALNEVRRHLGIPRPSFTLQALRKDSGSAMVYVHLPPDLAKDTSQLKAIVYEDAPSVMVLRGENAGVLMSGNSAVRGLFPVPFNQLGYGKAVLPLKPSWNRAKLNVAILASDKSLHILAAQNTALK
jgi:hypothetical protein